MNYSKEPKILRESEKSLENKKVVFKGEICRILWTNPNEPWIEGSFAICALTPKEIISGKIPACFDRNIVVKGYFPSISLHVEYKFEVTLKEDVKYGWGYQLNDLSLPFEVHLESGEGREQFLNYVYTPAELALLNKYRGATGETFYDVLERGDYVALTSIKGLGQTKARKIVQKFEAKKDNGPALALLAEWGIKDAGVTRLTRVFGGPKLAVEQIKRDPYILIQKVRGFGWKKTDKIALNMGLEPSSYPRVKAFIANYFYEQADQGDTWEYQDDMVEAIFEAIPELNTEKLVNYLQKMRDEEGYLFHDKDTGRIGLMEFRVLEQRIATQLLRLQAASKENLGDIEEYIKQAEEEVGFNYTEEQKTAIKTIFNNHVILITAKAGSGKSSTMLPVVKALEAKKKSVALCALSGKASLNLTEITHVEGQTIHRLIGKGLDGGLPKFHEGAALPCDFIILDEVSMVGGELFLELLNAIKTGATLVLLGDEGQLESIGLCNLLKDIKNSGVIPVAYLTKIHRQAAKSGIITESIKAWNGQQLIGPTFTGSEIRGELRDFKVEVGEDAQECAILALEEFKNFYLKQNIPIRDIVICTAKRCLGDCSTRVMNEYIQSLVQKNPNAPHLTQTYTDGDTTYKVNYYVGDRVIVLLNNYGVPTGKFNPDGSPQKVAVFNGNLGTVKKIVPGSLVVDLDLQGQVILSAKTELQNLQLGYAITTHRLQGSGIPYVIYICDPTAFTLLSKEHLYTGITRAKKFCTLIGTTYSIRKSIQTSRVTTKKTWLVELLQEQQKLLEEAEEKKKINPWADMDAEIDAWYNAEGLPF